MQSIGTAPELHRADGSPSPGPRPSSAADRTALSRDLSLFLVQFSIALSKTTTYPAGHPAMAAAVTSVIQRLRTVLGGRSGLTIGVARHQLIIEGQPTDPGNPVLRELALRLHRHQLVALRLSPGIEPQEFADLLARLGDETWRVGQPLGLQPSEELERWPHAKLEPLGLDQLKIGQRAVPSPDWQSHAAQLWLGLAAAAMLQPAADEGTSDRPPIPTAEVPGVPEIAQAITRLRGDPAYDKVIVEYLLRLTETVGEGPTGEAVTVRQRLAGLLRSLDPQTLQLLLGAGGGLPEQRRLMLDAARTLPVDAALKLLEAAASASQQHVSHMFLRILHKLAAHADTAGPLLGLGAESTLRDAVSQLVTGWSLQDPNPGSYRRLLDLLAHSGVEADHPSASDEGRSEADRILVMSLELGTTGESVSRAADEIIERGGLPRLLAFLDRCGTEPAAEAIWNRIASPAVVHGLLLQEPDDFRSVERLLDRLGAAGAEPMLDALEVAENLALRRRLVSRLSGLGPELVPIIVSRLPGKPWYVLRNLLLVLGSFGDWPPGFTPAPYANHSDSRVRREAYKLLLQRADARNDALLAALTDDDPGIVRLGLAAALDECPQAVLRPVLLGLDGPYRDPQVRLLAVRVLGLQPDPEARDWLLRHTCTKPRWFRSRRLESKSPELLTALSGLAAHWADDPDARAALRLAAASSDPEIRAAAQPPAP